jgi:hypothetical protein
LEVKSLTTIKKENNLKLSVQKIYKILEEREIVKRESRISEKSGEEKFFWIVIDYNYGANFDNDFGISTTPKFLDFKIIELLEALKLN